MPIATKTATKQYSQLQQQQQNHTANTMTASDDNNSTTTHASSNHSTNTTTATATATTANNPHAHAATAAVNLNNSSAANFSGGILSFPPLQPPPPPPPALSSGNLSILNGSIGIASAHAHPSSHTYGHAPSAVMTSATAAAFAAHANINAAMSSSSSTAANNYNMPTYANITVIPSNVGAAVSNVQAVNAANANAPIAVFMGSGLAGGAATATSAGRSGGGAIGVGGNTNDNNNNMDNTSEESNAVTIYRCRAPIASLDCMEEFSGTGGHLDFGRSISLGSNPALPLRHGSTPTPGLRYKNLGKSGLRVSNVGLGTWPVFSPGVSDEQAEAILRLAIESGINLFDISEAHSETEIGKILQRTGWKRTAYVITTKVYWSTKSEERGLSRKHIIECVKASLQRLQLQYIDIVIIHKADAMCPMEEVVRAMNYVIQQGWAMYWGTARWSQVEIMEAYTNCRQFNCITPIVEQSEYHMFCREKCELYLPEMYNKIGVGLMAWGPLSMALADTQNGEKLFLPKGSFKTKSQSYSWTEDEINRNAALSPQGSWGKDRVDEGRRHCDRLRDLAALAEKLGCSPTQLSIAWSLKHEPVQCLLLGATSAEQLHQSLQSLQLLPRLSTSVMMELERILENKPVRPPMISTLALR
ncbi:voltage-gated potassium channel subunit beta-2-like [Rhagoletis pomonella]|uniref:voltage-gated potassium channel subunit beta-2-like n=3 Tax=Rhagoletis TaxID=28609 RepID=UPI0017832731|nr:voltage-gated potassium channel subunit beta-2-like [Rhagoletis pomonella]